jgi:hypothetical protein
VLADVATSFSVFRVRVTSPSVAILATPIILDSLYTFNSSG